jgi:hypothetical protein
MPSNDSLLDQIFSHYRIAAAAAEAQILKFSRGLQGA